MPRIRSTAHEEREEEETGARALQLPLVGSPLFCSLVCFLVPPSPCPLRRPERLSLSSAAPLEKQTGRVFVALFCPPLSSPSSSSSCLLLKTLRAPCLFNPQTERRTHTKGNEGSRPTRENRAWGRRSKKRMGNEPRACVPVFCFCFGSERSLVWSLALSTVQYSVNGGYTHARLVSASCAL